MIRVSMFLVLALVSSGEAQDHPHLAQAWQANSVGDGEPGVTGLESYIYEGCGHHPEPPTSDTCMHGHVFNYGSQCVKYELDAGFDSKYSGTFYVNCDSVDCCTAGHDLIPDVKMWDIGESKLSKITNLGTHDITDLDGPVSGADTWNEVFKLPLVQIKVNYTYYVTTRGNDIITHRIDFSEPGDPHAQNGQILYGNFTVKHAEDLATFRDVFKAPAACLKPNTLVCQQDKIKAWERKYFRGRH